jgi:hypothetical protein
MEPAGGVAEGRREDMKWSNGRHSYYGRTNGRGKRQRSKITKGLKINYRKLGVAFMRIGLEKQKDMNAAQEFYKKRHGRYWEPPKTAAWGFMGGSESKKRRGPGPEAQIQHAIMEYLTAKRIFFWRNNSGVMRAGATAHDKGRFVRFGAVGSPDIIALHGGRLYGIEVKSPTGRLSEAQKSFGAKIEANGGTYVVARSVDDVMRVIS